MREQALINFVLFIVSIQVVEVVANNNCPDVLTKEMERIQVQFKFYEEYNKQAEKKNKVEKSKWYFNKLTIYLHLLIAQLAQLQNQIQYAFMHSRREKFISAIFLFINIYIFFEHHGKNCERFWRNSILRKLWKLWVPKMQKAQTICRK